MTWRSTRRARLWLVLSVIVIAIAGGAKKKAEEPGVRELGKVTPKELTEISGMAASGANPGVLWVSNDGDEGWLYAIQRSGKLAGAVKLPVPVSDIEEIAMGVGPEAGVDYVYIGDVGDNDSRRFEVAVLRFPEPQLDGEGGISIAAESVEQFRLAYPDGAHNAEAMLVDPTAGVLCVVTKDQESTLLYDIALADLRVGKRNMLRLAAEIDVDNVSAGAISRDGSRILLRREDQGWLWMRQPEQSVAEALQSPPQPVPVLGRRQGKNGEAIAFRPDGACYYTLSEGKKQAICEFNLPAADGGER